MSIPPVPWPRAPGGIAQVDELLRSNVEIVYLRKGKLCRSKVKQAMLAEICRSSPLLPLPVNPFRRGLFRARRRK